MDQDTAEAYNSLPYPGYTFPQTHPDRITTLARLHGIYAAEPDNCRVLELGCGDGSNLLSFACALPRSEFLGIDLSSVHIDEAKAASSLLGVSNVEFVCADITELDIAGLGSFDHIIAHGLFSWIPEPVRDAVLRIYSQCLGPNGIGYISFNAYPGCRIREVTRDLMLRFASPVSAPLEKVKAAINELEHLAAAAPRDGWLARVLDSELPQIRGRSLENVFHDDLGIFNQPFYFDEFCERLDAFGLEYVCESDATASSIADLGPDARKLIAGCSSRTEQEQMIDILRFRRFRSSLICRKGVFPDPPVTRPLISDFLLSSKVRHDQASSVADAAPVRFTASGEASFTINHPLTKAVLAILGRSWSRTFEFNKALAEAQQLLDEEISPSDVDLLQNNLAALHDAGFVKLHTHAPSIQWSPAGSPTVSRFARWQAARGSKAITTLSGLNLEPENDETRSLIEWFDGSRTMDEVAEMLLEQRLSKGIPAARESIFEELQRNVEQMAAAGLFSR
ncbi:MAG: class I SAM-dependent methyltransferase [Acidobacteria bacterium]|nr:class I SAM-dependent methyltransferase [Acidobacteriota bacterium]MCW5949183.1 class I SAM-dependent methyltransferase [Pyrinomonadaceae bacterium]